MYFCQKQTLRCCVYHRDAGLLCLLDLAPVLDKLSDMKSWYQIFNYNRTPNPCVSLCFPLDFQLENKCTHLNTQQSNQLFRIMITVIWKNSCNQFTTDTTRHQTKLPSASSPDRLAWTTKHNSVWLPLKSVFFFIWILVTWFLYMCK